MNQTNCVPSNPVALIVLLTSKIHLVLLSQVHMFLNFFLTKIFAWMSRLLDMCYVFSLSHPSWFDYSVDI
jgi:hypothetical protein